MNGNQNSICVVLQPCRVCLCVSYFACQQTHVCWVSLSRPFACAVETRGIKPPPNSRILFNSFILTRSLYHIYTCNTIYRPQWICKATNPKQQQYFTSFKQPVKIWKYLLYFKPVLCTRNSSFPEKTPKTNQNRNH